MNSNFSKAFIALQTKIAELVGEDNKRTIAYIDQNLGQLEMHERPTVAFPCVLIAFKDFRYTNLSDQVQEAEGDIIITLAADPFSATYDTVPDDFKQAGLIFWELEQLLFETLQGFEPIDDAGAMIRTRYQKDDRRPGLAVTTTTYSWSFQDYSAKRKLSKVPATKSSTAEWLQEEEEV